MYSHSQTHVWVFPEKALKQTHALFWQFELFISVEVLELDGVVKFIEVFGEEGRKACDHFMQKRAEAPEVDSLVALFL